MSGTSPKQLEADKTGDACRRNAQRSTKAGDACGPRTPTGCVAVIPDQGRGQASDRGSLTDELRQVRVPEDMLVEKIAVAYASRFSVLPSSPDTFGHVHFENAIERQLHKSGDACGLCIACKSTVAFSTLSPRRCCLSSKNKKLPNKPISSLPPLHLLWMC
jgi:hypothetical protein